MAGAKKRPREEETENEPCASSDASARPGVPVTIVTGFLGAGKTTLLNNILKNKKGLRVAVFVNEFGAVDVDGEILHQSQVDDTAIVTLDNGCICCTINENLVAQVQKVLETQALDHLFIETSGVACPGPIVDSLEVVEDLAFTTHIDAVLTVVDATSFDHTTYGSIAARQQVEAADVVLLTKTDLVEESEACKKEALLRSMMPVQGSPIIRVKHGDVPLPLITSLAIDSHLTTTESAIKIAPARAAGGHHLKHDSFSVYVYHAEAPFEPATFEEYMQNELPAGIMRAKGLLWLDSIPRTVIFQMSGRRTNPFETTETDALPTASNLVFIGRDFDGDKIRNGLDGCHVKRKCSGGTRDNPSVDSGGVKGWVNQGVKGVAIHS